MDKIIVYGSDYGSAKEYALYAEKLVDIKAFGYKDIKAMEHIDTIIYIGALYAGGVLGLARTVNRVRDISRLVIITVGLADPKFLENTTNIKEAIKNQLSTELYQKAEIYHVRGAIDYDRLKISHKIMMHLLKMSLENKAKEKWTKEDGALMDTYGKKVSFIDLESLKKIIDDLNL